MSTPTPPRSEVPRAAAAPRAAGGEQAWSLERLSHRRAIEALRAGVPNADAVAALGSGQPEVEDTVTSLLTAADAARRGSLLLTAGFGEGKSHLLTHLAHLGNQAGFVVSTVVISKETPLHDPTKVLRAAVDSAVAPGGVREVIADAVATLDLDTPAYAQLLRWLHHPETDLDHRFHATLYLLEQARRGAPGADEEFVDSLTRFWAGDPLPMPDLRRALRGVGAGKRFTFLPIKARDLAAQRLAFLPRLLRAAGYEGWMILLDEVELIGRYPVLQRARSYAELARWLGAHSEPDEPLVTITAITDDYEAAVLDAKNDRHIVPNKLRDKRTTEFDELAALAEIGMARIAGDAVPLTAPDAAELDRTYTTLRSLHGLAHNWTPPDVTGLERLRTTRMRQYVRAWINEWDLLRLDPSYHPSTEVLDIVTDYHEADPDER